ncbi:hypothetical protein Pint_09910 [Pistacia integerrima]|uniref:Uncharacterized protein n=1 Tax=Pistacia integerrima TaxID=434235 RepID=A0ACC0XM54_9ROSI|nr:hypothetical protein Pint_09910 [Pistacia integerrima]
MARLPLRQKMHLVTILLLQLHMMESMFTVLLIVGLVVLHRNRNTRGFITYRGRRYLRAIGRHPIRYVANRIERHNVRSLNLQNMVLDSDTQCLENCRMDVKSFDKLCHLLKSIGGLASTKNTTIEEMVASFLHIIAHHVKNGVLKRQTKRSSEIVSRNFHRVMQVVLRLHRILLKKLDPILENSTDDKWKWFKMEHIYGFTWTQLTNPGSAIDGRVLRDAINRRHGLKIPQVILSARGNDIYIKAGESAEIKCLGQSHAIRPMCREDKDEGGTEHVQRAKPTSVDHDCHGDSNVIWMVSSQRKFDDKEYGFIYLFFGEHNNASQHNEFALDITATETTTGKTIRVADIPLMVPNVCKVEGGCGLWILLLCLEIFGGAGCISMSVFSCEAGFLLQDTVCMFDALGYGVVEERDMIVWRLGRGVKSLHYMLVYQLVGVAAGLEVDVCAGL